MPCAVITGASSGLGQEYARYIARTHPEIDRFYFIARREERLEALKRELHRDAVILPLDLTQDESYAAISAQFRKDKPEIRLLICNAGYGKYGAFASIPLEEQYGMVDLNCRALTAVTQIALPYMQRAARLWRCAPSRPLCPRPT